MNRGVWLALAMFGLGACVEVKPPLAPNAVYTVPAEQLKKVEAGEMGAVAIDLKLIWPCAGLRVDLVNLDTKMVVRKVLVGTAGVDGVRVPAGAQTAVIAVPPGRYAFDGGTCVYTDYGGATYSYNNSLKALAIWVRTFKVEGGEVVYPGTPSQEKISHEFGIALTVLEKMNGRKTRSSDHYIVYEVLDEEARVRASVAQFNPALADRLVDRAEPGRLEKKVVVGLIDEAYAREAGNVAADNAEAAAHRIAAQDRVKTGIRAYILKQLEAEMKDILGPSLDEAAKADAI